MNDDRKIATEWRYNFHILPHLNSKTTAPMFTNFLYDVEALVLLLMHALDGDIALHFGKSEQRVKAANVAKESMVKLSTPAVQVFSLRIKLRGLWTKSYKIFTQCTEIIAD